MIPKRGIMAMFVSIEGFDLASLQNDLQTLKQPN
jgi:hypothetical protein